ncbi:MAG: murein transglycosylase A, partial [Pseudomonadota bacterium]
MKPPAEKIPALVRVEPNQWPNLLDDLDPGSLFLALEQSRVYLRRLPPDRVFHLGADSYTARHLLASLTAFEKLYGELGPGDRLTQALSRDFVLYKNTGRDGQGEMLCTGYYEPVLQGSLTPDDQYKYPLYGRPLDLISVNLRNFSNDFPAETIKGRVQGHRLIPYYTRHDIDRRGALTGQGLELAYVDDPIALFFLQIQGSGQIRLPDGKIIQLGYAESNGRPYRSLGRLMIDQGLIRQEDASLQAIRDWLQNRPDQAQDLMDHNQSYIFFRRLEHGPVGSLNVLLTPHRSVALDHRIFPKATLAWLKFRAPLVSGKQVKDWREVSRFVLVQDTGGAIRGRGRLDLFFGSAPEAETA